MVMSEALRNTKMLFTRNAFIAKVKLPKICYGSECGSKAMTRSFSGCE